MPKIFYKNQHNHTVDGGDSEKWHKVSSQTKKCLCEYHTKKPNCSPSHFGIRERNDWKTRQGLLFCQSHSLPDQRVSLSLVHAVDGCSKLPLSKAGQLVYQCATNISWCVFNINFEWLNFMELVYMKEFQFRSIVNPLNYWINVWANRAEN